MIYVSGGFKAWTSFCFTISQRERVEQEVVRFGGGGMGFEGRGNAHAQSDC